MAKEKSSTKSDDTQARDEDGRFTEKSSKSAGGSKDTKAKTTGASGGKSKSDNGKSSGKSSGGDRSKSR